jgi:mono/diheme cytochrome c family protein
LLERYGDDPITIDAALSGLRGTETTALEKLLQSAADQTAQRDAAITMLAGTIVRAGQDAGVQSVLSLIADERRPSWQRSALLRGAEVAVLSAVMPGTPPARRGGPTTGPSAPCPTCPGGRAGPGGAYAFPQMPAGPRAGNRTVRLGSEPARFAALAGRGGELGQRVSNVLARIEWPGKPGAAAPVAPLTASEQQRFNAGQEVYKNICVACHQPDGRGQERLAPPLVGSTLALASADIPARILLNGKEGPVGLMPPVGSTLNDEQIAAVLTYVRREWGQTGSPVDPATVKAVRAQTSDRSRPWTHDELLKLAAGGRGGQ